MPIAFCIYIAFIFEIIEPEQIGKSWLLVKIDLSLDLNLLYKMKYKNVMGILK